MSSPESAVNLDPDATPREPGAKKRRTALIVAAAATVVTASTLAFVLAGQSAASSVTLPDGTTVEVSVPRSAEADEVPGTEEVQPGESVAVDVVAVAGAEMDSWDLDVEVRHGPDEQECGGAGIGWPNTSYEERVAEPDTYYAGETLLPATYYFECRAEPGERLVVEVSNDSGSAVVVTEMP